MTPPETDLDRAERLEGTPLERMSDKDLLAECMSYVRDYAEPNSFFSGDNRMAELVQEALERWAPSDD